jgi:hypothetical protein
METYIIATGISPAVYYSKKQITKVGYKTDGAMDASGRAMATATALATATGTETATEFLTKRPKTPPESLLA